MTDEAAVASAYYYWGAVGYHRLSAFGQFPYPPQPAGKELDRVIRPSCLVPRDRVDPFVDVSFGAGWRSRASQRAFAGEALALDALAGALWAGYGFSRADGGRAVPSAGSTYALRLQVVALDVEGLEPGLHDVVLSPDGVGFSHRRALPLDDLTRCFVTQHIDYATAAAVVVVIGRLARAAMGYGERAYRMLHLEAGHLGQNVSLVAAAHGIGHVCIAGFDDTVGAATLGLDEPSELLVYGIALGVGGAQ